MFGLLAESPAALEGYASIGAAFEKSSLSTLEQQIVLLSASFENGCTYCMAAHSTVAHMIGADAEVVKAMREERVLSNARLEALRRFTRAVVKNRGWVSKEDMQAFLQAGYDKAQVLEVLTGVAQKTLSNYTSHIAHTPLDEAFTPHAWAPPRQKAAV